MNLSDRIGFSHSPKLRAGQRSRAYLATGSSVVIAIVMLVLVVAVAARGIGGGATRPRTGPAARSGSSPPATLSDSRTVALPSGYDAPIAIASDPASSGIWLLAGSSNDVSVFEWDESTSQLRQISLGDPDTNPALIVGDEGGLAVDANGVVWVGLRNTLFRVDPSSDTVTSVNVPVPGDNSYVEEHRPPAVKGFHGIESISVAPTGDVAIAMEATTGVEIYAPASGSFSSVNLPDNDSPNTLAYSSNGDLAVVATAWPSGQDGAIDLVSSTGSNQRAVMDAISIAGAGAGFVLTGTSSVSYLQSSSDADQSPTDTSRYVAPENDDVASLIDAKVSAVATPNGDTIVASGNGLIAIDDATGVATSVELPTVACSGVPNIPLFSASTTTSTSADTCQEQPTAFAVDSQGNIWLTTNLTTSLVEVPVSSY